MEDVKKRVKQLLAKNCGKDSCLIKETDSFDDLGMDEYEQCFFVMDCEEDFNIEIPNYRIDRIMKSVSSFIDEIQYGIFCRNNNIKRLTEPIPINECCLPISPLVQKILPLEFVNEELIHLLGSKNFYMAKYGMGFQYKDTDNAERSIYGYLEKFRENLVYDWFHIQMSRREFISRFENKISYIISLQKKMLKLRNVASDGSLSYNAEMMGSAGFLERLKVNRDGLEQDLNLFSTALYDIKTRMFVPVLRKVIDCCTIEDINVIEQKLSDMTKEWEVGASYFEEGDINGLGKEEVEDRLMSVKLLENCLTRKIYYLQLKCLLYL